MQIGLKWSTPLALIEIAIDLAEPFATFSYAVRRSGIRRANEKSDEKWENLNRGVLPSRHGVSNCTDEECN